MITAKEAMQLTRTWEQSNKYTLETISRNITNAASMGYSSINITREEMTSLDRKYLDLFGYTVRDCHFEGLNYIQISWDNK